MLIKHSSWNTQLSAPGLVCSPMNREASSHPLWMCQTEHRSIPGSYSELLLNNEGTIKLTHTGISSTISGNEHYKYFTDTSDWSGPIENGDKNSESLLIGWLDVLVAVVIKVQQPASTVIMLHLKRNPLVQASSGSHYTTNRNGVVCGSCAVTCRQLPYCCTAMTEYNGYCKERVMSIQTSCCFL